ncbi:MAG: hypothetical protein OQJ76_04250 [Rhodospirillales bacterium]|nr:hypothetical protein [Rhodospirillales bacterium]
MLSGVGALVPSAARANEVRGLFLRDDDRVMLSAICPAVLNGALPDAGRDGVVAEIVTAIDRLLFDQSPHVQADLRHLFDLLTFAPTRMLVAGVWSPWDKASTDEIIGFLDGFRGSRFAALRSAYFALTEMTGAAWYGDERSWDRIGYPGPPEVIRAEGNDPA